MIKAIGLFYVFKFSPKTIDNRSNRFWQNAVIALNDMRSKTNGGFYLYKFFGLYLRDPYSRPANYFYSSSFHPFCFKKYKPSKNRIKNG